MRVYRFFDETTGKMEYPHLKHIRISFDYPDMYMICDDDDSIINKTSQNTTLLQAIGIKDVDGDNIYEGDIVQYVDMYSHTKKRVILWDREEARFVAHHDGNYTKITTPFKVIGNIYENKELLSD